MKLRPVFAIKFPAAHPLDKRVRCWACLKPWTPTKNECCRFCGAASSEDPAIRHY